MSTLHGAGGLTGTHVPVPLEPRPIRQTVRPTGFDWGTDQPDTNDPPTEPGEPSDRGARGRV